VRPPDPLPHTMGAAVKQERATTSRGRTRIMLGVLTALMFAGACCSLGHFRRFYWKQEIRPAMEYVLRNAQPGDAVACVSVGLQPAAEYYLQERDLPVIPRALESSLGPVTSPDEPTPEEEVAALRNLASLWVLALDQPRSEPTNERVRARLDTFMRLTDERSFDHVRLAHYLPRRNTPAPSPVGAGTTVADAAPALSVRPPR
jgi:hypothetical protein